MIAIASPFSATFFSFDKEIIYSPLRLAQFYGAGWLDGKFSHLTHSRYDTLEGIYIKFAPLMLGRKFSRLSSSSLAGRFINGLKQ
jgi:hypothetical protein